MKTNIAVFADHAEVDKGGALVRLERPYNFLTASSFPVRGDDLKLVMGFTCEPADFERTQQISVRIVDPDGGEMATLTADPLQVSAQAPGYPVSFCQVVPLTIRFPREGGYNFQIRVNGEPLTDVPLYIGQLPEGVVQ